MIYLPLEDSLMLAKQVKKYAKNKKVLDMGSGDGIQAKAALNAGAKSILASDINHEVIKHLGDRDIKAILSDLFSNIEDKFDLIIFNPPYLPRDKREDSESSRITSGGKKGDEIILRFLKSLNKHLTTEGVSLIVISSLTPKIRIIAEIKKQKLSHRVLSSQKFFFETLEVWEIKKEDEERRKKKIGYIPN